MFAPLDEDFVEQYLTQSAIALDKFRSDPTQIALLSAMTDAVVSSMVGGGKLLIAGNGGSAGDAQHIAGEFTGRMLYDRPPLAAVALHADTSSLTAIGNDYGFDHVFARHVMSLGRKGDVILGLSTSGRSVNVLRALEAGRTKGLLAIGFTGADGGDMASVSDMVLKAPSTLTPVIQQIHMVAAHILCAMVERIMFPRTA
jgi:D-sedoheptulose 7-phosphate isomerase